MECVLPEPRMEVIADLHEVEPGLLGPYRLLDDLDRPVGLGDQLEPQLRRFPSCSSDRRLSSGASDRRVSSGTSGAGGPAGSAGSGRPSGSTGFGSVARPGSASGGVPNGSTGFGSAVIPDR